MLSNVVVNMSAREGGNSNVTVEVNQTLEVEEGSNPAPSATSSGDDTESSLSILTAPSEAPPPEPVFGMRTVSGRMQEMEDAVSVQTNLCRPEINRGLPVHFFGVYDGHGGSHVAGLCREMMHLILEQELMNVDNTQEGMKGGEPGDKDIENKEGWTRALKRCFQRMDEVVLNSCLCRNDWRQCRCRGIMEVEMTGTTAVMAIITTDHIVVANCGDSRAVLCREGTSIPLSFDHKPDRSDELARIKSCGGRVIVMNGARVEGMLGMSRAIGDRYLKPFITSEPEITFTRREAGDECLILASDGLWDVLPNEVACGIASGCLRRQSHATTEKLNSEDWKESESTGQLYPNHTTQAAALLTRLALGRQSPDNISVVVVDLQRS